jgi:hypothetical protein
MPEPCIGPHEVPFFYAALQDKENPWSFGPTAEPYGHRSLRQLKSELTDRLCGTPNRGGDRRLYVALYAAILGGDPNIHISHKQWERGVPKLLQMFDWGNGSHVRTESGSRATMAMEPRGRKRDPKVHAASNFMRDDRVLRLAVNGPDSVPNRIDLRLRCGFQPVFRSHSSLPEALG